MNSLEKNHKREIALTFGLSVALVAGAYAVYAVRRSNRMPSDNPDLLNDERLSPIKRKQLNDVAAIILKSYGARSNEIQSYLGMSRRSTSGATSYLREHGLVTRLQHEGAPNRGNFYPTSALIEAASDPVNYPQLSSSLENVIVTTRDNKPVD